MMSQTTVLSSSLSGHRVTVGGVTPQEIIINNCLAVHIGPKYIHNNNVTINNGVCCVDDADSVSEEVTAKSLCSVIYKCVKVPYGIHLKILLCGASFTVIVLVVVVTLLTIQSHPRPPLQLDNDDYPLNKRFVSREDWGAAPPCDVLMNNTMPLQLVIFIHTSSSGTCNNFASCKLEVLGIQQSHMKECANDPNRADDIRYNFVIGSDGHIFVGRGWDKVGGHTKGSNIGSIGVAFIGDFRKDEPSPMMLDSAKTLLEVGVARSKLKEDYQLFGHCQRTERYPYSPGVNILKHIQTWPHWNISNLTTCADFTPSVS